ncbi:argininosuccinate synthase [Buchnera aphidicola]|uniref:argininosuccinate synthase n=1 Tax=Buchnera aphidicola TaxID=9 RepID=UPI0030EED02A
MFVKNNSKKEKVVLAYSGGLDTSAIIPWLKENYDLDVIAMVADVGQSKKDLLGIETKAINSGASKCYVIDLKKVFVKKYVYPVLKTGALYEGKYLLGTAIARPIIAKAQIQLANKIKAKFVCHGATGKGNDQVRFEMAYAFLSPKIKIIAPWREWNMKSRKDLIKYLKNKNITTDASLKKIYSRDENIFHISTEGGNLEDTWSKPKKNTWVWTKNPEISSEKPQYVLISIKKGHVIGVDKVFMSPIKCLKKLNYIGSLHGVGRIDIVENRLIGMKSRGCYETPGGSIMYEAIRSIEQLTLDRECFYWRQIIGLQMSQIVYDGKWFLPIRKVLQVSSNQISKKVNGEVLIKLYKGSITVIKKRSNNSIYSKSYSTFEKDSVYNQKDASGFINIYSLSSKIMSKNK